MDKTVSRTTAHDYKVAYEKELSRKRKAGDVDLSVKALPAKKRGRKLLLGDEIDKKVQKYLRALRDNAGSVSIDIVIAAAKGIVMKTNKHMLIEYGGHVDLSKNWAKALIKRMGFVKRKGTTSKSKDTVDDFKRRKAEFLEQVRTTVVMEEIPSELILNWDQTGLNIVPASHWTLEQKGARRAELIGVNDKRQITAVFCGSLSGDFLPLQVIYQGKTPRCHPRYQFPLDWDVSHTPTHWSNEETMKEYLYQILFPYVDRVREDLELDDDHPALAIFDNFSAQVTPNIMQLLAKHNIHVVTLPPNCTNRLQPMDLTVNKAAKDFLKRKFTSWYAQQVAVQLKGQDINDDDFQVQPVDLSMAAMKHIGARWLEEMHSYVKDNPQLIVNGFMKAGIPQAIDLFYEEESDEAEDVEESDDEAEDIEESDDKAALEVEHEVHDHVSIDENDVPVLIDLADEISEEDIVLIE